MGKFCEGQTMLILNMPYDVPINIKAIFWQFSKVFSHFLLTW